MVRLARITDDYAAMGQLLPEEMREIAALGYKTVVNNRPDGEEWGQPTHEEMRAAAEEAGLVYHFVPMTMQTLSPELVERHRDAMLGSAGPVLAFCRSGNRSTVLWSLVEACHRGRSADDVIAQAAEAGYDISGVRPMIEALSRMIGGASR